jgi:hypothetical protein
MRLNDGMPVWHVSASVQFIRNSGQGIFIADPDRALAIAVDLLRGVGGDTEWWTDGEYKAAVYHLRVPITPAEYLATPPGVVTSDAGKTGPQRPRTR